MLGLELDHGIPRCGDRYSRRSIRTEHRYRRTELATDHATARRFHRAFTRLVQLGQSSARVRQDVGAGVDQACTQGHRTRSGLGVA